MAGTTGLEPATSAVTGQRSDQLSYVPRLFFNNLGLCHIESSASQHSPFSLDSTLSPLWTEFWGFGGHHVDTKLDTKIAIATTEISLPDELVPWCSLRLLSGTKNRVQLWLNNWFGDSPQIRDLAVAEDRKNATQLAQKALGKASPNGKSCRSTDHYSVNEALACWQQLSFGHFAGYQSTSHSSSVAR